MFQGLETECTDWLMALSPVTRVRHCELVAAAGGDASPGLGPGSGPGLCRADRKHPDCTEPMLREPRWRGNEHTAYLPKYQEEKKKIINQRPQEQKKRGRKETSYCLLVWCLLVLGLVWACLWSWSSGCCCFEAWCSSSHRSHDAMCLIGGWWWRNADIQVK